MSGIWKRVDDTTLEITELPVGKWTVQYKTHLDKLMGETDAKKIAAKTKNVKAATTKARGGKAAKLTAKSKSKSKKQADKADVIPIVKDYKDYCSDMRVHFIIEVPTLKDMTDASKKNLQLLLQPKLPICTCLMKRERFRSTPLQRKS